MYPEFSTNFTATNRLSSRHPNLQNMDRDTSKSKHDHKPISLVATNLRRVIQAPLGYSFILIDYSQQELVIAAYLSKDPTFIRNVTLEDHHKKLSADLSKIVGFEITRDNAKTIIFGELYGRGIESLAKFLKISLEMALKISSGLQRIYPVFME